MVRRQAVCASAFRLSFRPSRARAASILGSSLDPSATNNTTTPIRTGRSTFLRRGIPHEEQKRAFAGSGFLHPWQYGIEFAPKIPYSKRLECEQRVALVVCQSRIGLVCDGSHEQVVHKKPVIRYNKRLFFAAKHHETYGLNADTQYQPAEQVRSTLIITARTRNVRPRFVYRNTIWSLSSLDFFDNSGRILHTCQSFERA